MSSHYVYVSCTYPDCDEYDSIYTGDTELDAFSDSQWEGETVNVLCKAHETETVSATVRIPVKDYNRLKAASDELDALYAYGVDNWEGYDEAMSGEDE